MTAEEKQVWDIYFAAAASAELSKPAQTGSGPLSALAGTPQARINRAAQAADLMLEERKRR
jgi:hypothetical protein